MDSAAASHAIKGPPLLALMGEHGIVSLAVPLQDHSTTARLFPAKRRLRQMQRTARPATTVAPQR